MHKPGRTEAQPELGGGEVGPSSTQGELFPHLQWTGEVPAQKWMNFYTRVVSKFATGQGLRLRVTLQAAPEGGVSKQNVEDTRAALRELGLDGEVETE